MSIVSHSTLKANGLNATLTNKLKFYYGDRLNLSFSINNKLISEVNSEEAKNITFFAYEELLALKRACNTLGFGSREVEDLCYNNAKALIDGARRDIFGT